MNTNEKEAVKALWTRNKVLSLIEAERRIVQVSTLIICDQILAGVSTIYEDYLQDKGPYFYFRMFIDPHFRGSTKLRTTIMQINFHTLKNRYVDQKHGLVLELENPKLARLGKHTSYMQHRGYTYAGKSERGLQLWYVDFKNPQGIFAQTESGHGKSSMNLPQPS